VKDGVRGGIEGGKGMPIRVNLRDAETGSRIEMDLEHENTVEDAIESAASFWDKQAGAFVIRHGNKILRGRTTMTELGIREGDLLELIPDPEGG